MFRTRIAPTLLAIVGLAAAPIPSRAEGAWTIETVESALLAAGTSLALDAAGAPRMAYNSGAQPRYARRDAGGWTTESLLTPPAPADAAGSSGEISGVQLIYYVVPSLALDPVTALPRIAYGKSPENDVWYAERSAAGWVYERLSTIGFNPSLALDPQSRPHVGYREFPAGMIYAVRDGGTWGFEPIGAGVDSRSLRLDAQGVPHLALSLDSPNSDLLYASRDAGGWSFEAGDTSGSVGHAASLALDGSGVPHISYFDATAHALRYATRSGGQWTVETVVAPIGDWCPNSLALAPGGQPFIAFYDATAGDLRFARREAGVWSSGVVDSAGNVGDYCSLALDDQGRPHVGYYDTSDHIVRYATRSAVVSVDPPPAAPGVG